MGVQKGRLMVYQFRGELTIEQELANAAAAKEEAKARIAERRAQLRKLKNDQKQIQELGEYEARLAKQIHDLSAAGKLPEPIYGGRAGLKAAADEARGYDRSRNSRTRPERQDAA